MFMRPHTADHIVLGGVYRIRQESEYEALGYKTDITIPARHHTVLVTGAIPKRPGYWHIMTIHQHRISPLPSST
jgi:hypothetical protein